MRRHYFNWYPLFSSSSCLITILKSASQLIAIKSLLNGVDGSKAS